MQALRKNPSLCGRLGRTAQRCRFPTSVFVSAPTILDQSTSAPVRRICLYCRLLRLRQNNVVACPRGLVRADGGKVLFEGAEISGPSAAAQSSFRIIRKRYCPGAPCAATWRLAWKLGMSPPQSRTSIIAELLAKMSLSHAKISFRTSCPAVCSSACRLHAVWHRIQSCC